MTEEGEKILIVDDDFDVRRLVSRTLQRAGFAVSQAVDGCEAIETLRREPFDLIFLDLKMPHMDGVDTFKMLKALDPSAEVVILTGHASVNTVISTLREGGAYDYLTKPVDNADELVRVARKALARRRLSLETMKHRREIKTLKRRIKEATDKKTKGLRRQMESLEGFVENEMAFFKRISIELKDQLAHMEVGFVGSEKPSLGGGDLDRFKGTLSFLDYFRRLAGEGGVGPDLGKRVKIARMAEMISRGASRFSEGKVTVAHFDGGGCVKGDVEMLTWAILHLVENGLRFAKPGGKGVSLSFSHRGDRLDIVVADDGVGIPRSETEEIFGLFYQGIRHPQVKGKGVGLAVVKSIVEEHRGTISFESKPRKGSTFIISLPLSVQERAC